MHGVGIVLLGASLSQWLHFGDSALNFETALIERAPIARQVPGWAVMSPNWRKAPPKKSGRRRR
jgi:hypothetical protein